MLLYGASHWIFKYGSNGGVGQWTAPLNTIKHFRGDIYNKEKGRVLQHMDGILDLKKNLVYFKFRSGSDNREAGKGPEPEEGCMFLGVKTPLQIAMVSH